MRGRYLAFRVVLAAVLAVVVVAGVPRAMGAGAVAPASAVAAPAALDCSWVAGASRLLAKLHRKNDPRAEGIRAQLLALGFGPDGAPPPQCTGAGGGGAGGDSGGTTPVPGASGNPDEPLNGTAERGIVTPAGAGTGRTVQVASGQPIPEAQPGDTVVIAAGTYETFTPASGSQGSYVTYRAAPDAEVVIEGGLLVGAAQWLHLDGLTVRGGVAGDLNVAMKIEGASNVALTGVKVDGSPDGGITVFDSNNIHIEGCDVRGTNSEGTGADSEAVSLSNVDGFEIFNCRVHENGEEGIDVKYGSKNGAVHHNLAWGNRGPNIYLDGCYHVDVHHNWAWGATSGDKPGIMVAAEREWWPAGTATDLTIRDNTVWDNGAGSILFWSDNGAFDRVTVQNNRVDKPVDAKDGVTAADNAAAAIPQLTDALLGGGSSSSSAPSDPSTGSAGGSPSGSDDSTRED